MLENASRRKWPGSKPKSGRGVVLGLQPTNGGGAFAPGLLISLMRRIELDGVHGREPGDGDDWSN